jgi:hypothetical protein
MNLARRWHEGSPRGGAPRGESGLIPLPERSASALYLHRNLHASWGMRLGIRNRHAYPPAYPHAYPPGAGVRWRDRALHVGTACRMFVLDVACPSGAQQPLNSHNVCFLWLRTCRVARTGLQWAGNRPMHRSKLPGGIPDAALSPAP